MSDHHERRAAPPQQQRQSRRETPHADPLKQQNAIQRVSGTFQSPAQVNERLQLAAAEMNLVSPATAVGALPEGCGIALSAVSVDLANETYDVGSGKRALAKSALDKIAASIGVSWISDECRRVDDGSDPHYCHFVVAGRYRAFDGQVQVVTGHKEMDLREGSPTCVEIEAHVDKFNRNPRNQYKRDAVNQIRQMRAHILAHAESKAKLRAVRSIGVRSSYAAEELQKPFICARIMFTGQTSDPELRKVFAEKTADAFLAGTHTLYGAQQPTHPSRQISAGHTPPPLGALPAEPEDLTDDDVAGAIDTEGEDTGHADHADQAAGADESLSFTIPGGPEKGTPLSKASDKNLQYWCARLERDLNDGVSRDEQRDVALHHAICAELERRAKPGPGGGGAAPAARSGGQQEFKT